jgi:hypothetical protein
MFPSYLNATILRLMAALIYLVNADLILLAAVLNYLLLIP